MVGNVAKRAEAEPIYREILREMDDKELESRATRDIWLCETTLGGPWTEDVWHRVCVKQECERRGEPEIFERAKRRVLRVLEKTQLRISD